MTLINCTAEDNRKAGFAVWYPSSYTKLYNCTDTGSEVGYKFDYTDNVYVENCTSIDADRYGIYAANAGKITAKGLAIVTPKGDGSKNNVFGVSGYPVRESSFDVDTYGGEGAAVSCPSGQSVQFSGIVRSNAAQPVAVSGSVDTSRLNVQPYSGGKPSPGYPTLPYPHPYPVRETGSRRDRYLLGAGEPGPGERGDAPGDDQEPGRCPHACGHKARRPLHVR
ncbi:right-handed parallel beta-helix repeat-containing protein [Methanoculleus sp. 10]|uniref:right-handed parallel beta-helix repeat-containing protein n=1 Tax=Methanoculleus sp. 10 TaxID=430615 RepID=UPI0026004564|nr:right-handed parallel beta-helix repeat-containing protein [Methanoculleus sp. 10]